MLEEKHASRLNPPGGDLIRSSIKEHRDVTVPSRASTLPPSVIVLESRHLFRSSFPENIAIAWQDRSTEDLRFDFGRGWKIEEESGQAGARSSSLV